MRQVNKNLISIFNDWIDNHITEIFYQYLGVSMYEAFNAIGCAQELIYIQMKWTYAQEIMNWVWIIDSIFAVYSAIIAGIRRIKIKW